MSEAYRHGLLLVDKQTGGTSHDVVQRVRRLIDEKKVGHCGTLDPNATGLLVITVGRATRLTRFLIRAPKIYEGRIRFGVATDTYDAVGQVVASKPTEGLTRAAIETAMAGFEGRRDQLPPPYSAKKVKGKKYYELARRGEEIPREPKSVEVFEFSPAGDFEDDEIGFRLACSSGTYARTLAHDVGEELGTGAHLASLRRLSVGPFEVDAAATLEELAKRLDEGTGMGKAWVPFDEIPLPFSEVTADAQQESRIAHGQTVLVRALAGEEGDWVKLVDRRHRFIAVGTVIERIGNAGVGIVRPRVVFK